MPQDRSGGLARIHTLDELDEITRAASARSGLPFRAPAQRSRKPGFLRLLGSFGFSREDQPFVPAASPPERQYAMIQEFFPGRGAA
jgi:hypothetical protein